jgi:acetyl-CoA carboxylase biotin carboxylase subunit
MIAKIIVSASNRSDCLVKAARALEELVIAGVHTTADLHKKLVRNSDIISGDFDVHWLESYLATNQQPEPATQQSADTQP